ncbi:ECF transporter S component [Veillonella criceti]|uniref:Predicted membrane protein n=1 Tax=Veillonella criceti TaxID=103891 RepID=A0A380NM10_9FIRM|nr:ECF transporter S component [Veillonella criceti]SUP42646.1 Predicted membrane protein [Veillonella criceti]
MNFSIRDIIYIGMLSALCALATTLLIPLPTGAMVHLGSAALFTIAALFGGLYGGLAGAIGSGLFDLVMGHSAYTLFSIIIKGLSGLIVGYMVVGFRPNPRKARESTWMRLLLAMLVGSIWTALGYFVAWEYVLNSFAAAVSRLPATFLTSGVGIIVALFLVNALRKVIHK